MVTALLAALLQVTPPVTPAEQVTKEMTEVCRKAMLDGAKRKQDPGPLLAMRLQFMPADKREQQVFVCMVYFQGIKDMPEIIAARGEK